MDHPIKVECDGIRVSATPQDLERTDGTPVLAGHTVTWQLPNTPSGLEILFIDVLDRDANITLGPTRPQGPFSDLKHEGNQVIGVVADFDQPVPPGVHRTYRFTYQIMSNGIPLKWAGQDGAKGGSVDVPANPPTR